MSFESFIQQCEPANFHGWDYKKGILRWMPSFKRHVLPKWMKLAVFKASKTRGHKFSRTYLSAVHFQRFFPSGTFDHWGSVRWGEEDYVVSMPYGCESVEAIAAAAVDLGIGFAHFEKSPYHPNACLLVFWENR